MESAQKVDEQYKGPGRLTSALGLGALYSIVPSIATGIATVLSASKITEQNIDKSLKGMTKTSVIGGVITLGAIVAGLVVGWKRSGNAEKQYEQVARQHNAGIDKVAALSENNAQLVTELSSEKRRFTETLGKQRGAHGEHAGHADKVISDKHAAEGKQLAM